MLGRSSLLLWCAGLMLTSCSAGDDPAATPAPQADDPACATVIRNAPDSLLDQPRIAAGEQPVTGVLTWGSPAIVLRCGAPEVGPTTLACIAVNDVDWVVDDSNDPIRFVTYGRSPALEVLVPLRYGRENATAALVDLAAVATALPSSRSCT